MAAGQPLSCLALAAGSVADDVGYVGLTDLPKSWERTWPITASLAGTRSRSWRRDGGSAQDCTGRLATLTWGFRQLPCAIIT